MQDKDTNSFTWNDLVKVKANAPIIYSPGKIAVICGMSQVITQKEAEFLLCKNEEWVYTIEFGDGSSIEVPESYLEKYSEEK